ncbi:thioredoxin-like protein [Schizophyllum amplum]|uniref:Thioredoxin-like protein n=1 Tax=Schizophyllum amplum TaxID=97359 RepID=A0A550CD42_9AGAR|nr:thioredoxin-like protein [Auriculariopsis ampla]
MASTSNFHVVDSPEQFQGIMSQDLNRVSLINFWAPWAEPCKQMNEVVRELAKKYAQVQFLEVEAESQADIAESFDVEAVPTFIILKGHALLDRISGADAPKLAASVAKHTSQPSVAPQSQTSQAPARPSADVPMDESPDALNERMRALMTQDKVVLFMKGDRDTPRCGFSRKMINLLNDHKLQYATFDILEDEAVRQGLKELNDWPTFPQLIVNGEFVGGLDIVKEMVDNGEFSDIVAQ